MTNLYREKLELATNSGHLRLRFEQNLRRIWEKPVIIEDFYVTKVFPRKEGGFSIQYDIGFKKLNGFPEKRVLLGGRLLGPEESQLESTARRDRDVFVLEDLRLIVPVFPFDPELSQLRWFYGADEASVILDRLRTLPELEDNDLKPVRHEVLGYRLERRCVLRYTFAKRNGVDSRGERFQIIAKIMRPRHSKRTEKSLVFLEENGFDRNSNDRLTVPHLYYSDNSAGGLFIEAVPGVSLHDIFGSPVFRDACHSAGKLIRKLHSISTGELPEYTATDELESLQEKVNLAYRLFPQLTDSFASAYGRLCEKSACVAGEYTKVIIHRDFYDKQVLFSPERSTLLDCDNLAAGDAAVDFGNFTAHLILRQLQTPDQARRIREGVNSFDAGYAETDKDFKSRMQWWRGATLIRLAVLYSLRPRWKGIAANLLVIANEVLNQDGV